MTVEDTRFGFNWGPVVVERMFEDERYGYCMRIFHKQSRKFIEVRISPAGKKIDIVEGNDA